MVKITVIGCCCVITSRPFWSVAWTMLPGSTSRRPTTPEVGAVIRLYVRFSFALSTCARSLLIAASV